MARLPKMPSGWEPSEGMLVDLPLKGATLSSRRLSGTTWDPGEANVGVWEVVKKESVMSGALWWLRRPGETECLLALFAEELYPYTPLSPWRKWLQEGVVE